MPYNSMRFKYEKDVTLIIPYNTNQLVEWVGTYITFTVINIQMAKKTFSVKSLATISIIL